MIVRFFSALFWAIVLGLVGPICYLVFISGFETSFMTIGIIAAASAAVGAVIGALFTLPFRVIMDALTFSNL